MKLRKLPMFAALVLSGALTIPAAAAPVEYNIPATQDEFEAAWEVVPGDEGTGTWEWVSDTTPYAQTPMVAKETIAPSLIIAEPIEMKAGETFYIQANVSSDHFDNDAWFYIVYGTSKDNLTTMKIDSDTGGVFKCWGNRGGGVSFSWHPGDTSDYRELKVEADGDYYIGVRPRRGSTTNMSFCVASIKIDKMINYPEKVTGLNAVANNDGSLGATLTWTWPTKNLDGSAIEGTVSANIYRSVSNSPADIFKSECLIGTVTDGIPGETGSFIDGENSLIPIAEAGKYYYYVTPFNAQGENSNCSSSTIKECKWIGEDTECLNPAQFNVALVDGEVHVEWSARIEGKNGGWINPDEFYHRIYRSKDGGDFVLICDNYKGEPPYIDNTGFDGLGLYTYEVKGVYKGNETIAAPTKYNGTNKVFTGGTMPLPYSQDFNSADALTSCTVLSTNSSGSYQWKLGTGSYSGCLRFNSTSYYNTTSILVTPPFSLEAGKTYKISCLSWVEEEEVDDGYGWGSYYETVPHDLFFTAGTVATIDGQTEIGSKYIDQTSSSKMGAEAYFSPETSGTYYFGVKASFANAYGIFIDDLLIEESATVPAEIADFSASPASNGANAAEISFTVPDKTNGGQALASVSKVEVTRTAYDGEDETSEIVKTLTGDDCTPGKAVAFTDELVDRGYYSYSVVSYAGETASQPASSEKVWYGFDDPNPISSIGIGVTENNGIPTVSWSELSLTGSNHGAAHGGYVAAENIRYNIYRYDQINTEEEPVLVGQTSKLIFTDNSITSARWGCYRYGIAAVNKDQVNNKEYESRIVTEFPNHILGDVIELPYEPDFTDENTAKIWHTSTCRLDGGIIFSGRGETEGKDYMAYMPPFRTDATQNLGCSLDLTFSRKNAEYEESFEVYLCALDAETPSPDPSDEGGKRTLTPKAVVIPGADSRTLVATIPVTALHETPESKTVKFDLPAAGRYRVAFRCSSPDNQELKIHTLVMKNDIITGIDSITPDEIGGDVEIYTLQGVRVSGDSLESGIYIIRSKTSVKKVLVK